MGVQKPESETTGSREAPTRTLATEETRVCPRSHFLFLATDNLNDTMVGKEGRASRRSGGGSSLLPLE